MNVISDVIPISDLRHRQEEVMQHLSQGPVILTQRGRGTAVLLAIESWRQLVTEVERLSEALEGALDVCATDEAMARIRRGEETTRSHEEVWTELDRAEAAGELPH